MNLTAAESKVAVLLNANAKRVSRRVHNALRHVVPEDDLFLSRTVADARNIARAVVDRQYRTVFTGGGDGTFVSFVTEILDAVREHATFQLPRFGVLKLGTGNALAGMVGATAGEGILDDVLRARAGEVPSVRRIDLITTDGRLTPFAGIGLDAAILNDYVAVKRKLGQGRLKRLGTGASGYALAVATRTLPHYLVHRKSPEVEVINGRGVATLVGADGKPVKDFGPGELLFRGPASMCAGSTVPFYGFNFKMFPFAGMVPGRMQLRVSNLKPFTVVTHLDAIWKGRFRHPDVSDFLVEDVIVRANEKLPLQIGGDAEGYRDEIRLGLAPRQIELVDFSALN
ncbi:diacylglycerol/lipid kinase family protein [Vulgatibacter sp.]|uniref:diacylglycerol/lipid kinase family protein n=1 Tax=Vulgatibacter sp. TaxID=1971226 RepID=UPI003568B282